jgi:hypothetical protein
MENDPGLSNTGGGPSGHHPDYIETPEYKVKVRVGAPSPPLKQSRRFASILAVVKRQKSSRLLIIGIVSVILLGAIGFGLIHVFKTKYPIPKPIASKITFVIFYPTNDSVVKVDRDTIKYDTGNGLLSFVARMPNGTKIILSEQATPESFVDILPAYTALIERLQGYSSFETPNGKVSLTHPKELQGLQSALMNAKGTLMFARPEKNISDADWHRIFNSLQQLPQSR